MVILRAILNKASKKHPTKQQLYDHLSRRPSKVDEQGMREEQGRIHKRRSLKDPLIRTCKCRTTSWNLPSIALYRHSM